MQSAVDFHPEAADELEGAVTWYSRRSVGAARGFVLEIESGIKAILRSPTLYPTREGCRQFMLRRYPYSLVYRTTPFGLEILAIAHGKRRPGYWTERV